MPAPSGLSRRELWVDARDLQSESEPDKPLTVAEYAAVLSNRGKEKMSEHRLVQSFETEVRIYNPTYTYREDYLLGDTITTIDERLAITVDAVAQGARWAVSGDVETLSLTFGYDQPTIGTLLRRKEDK